MPARAPPEMLELLLLLDGDRWHCTGIDTRQIATKRTPALLNRAIVMYRCRERSCLIVAWSLQSKAYLTKGHSCAFQASDRLPECMINRIWLQTEKVPMHIHHVTLIINARRMREGYCSHPVCLCVCVSVYLCVCVSVCLCVCVSVTALALTYDACATKLAYQCILRCTQKVLNWAFSLKSLLSRVPACFLLALPNGRPFWNIEVATWTLTTITSNCQCLTTAFSEFDDHYPMQRPLPREGKYSYSTLYIRCLVAIWELE